MKKIFLVLFMLGPVLASAQELVEKNISVQSTSAEGPAARRDLQEKAVSKLTEELSKELIGPERYEKNKNTIHGKISKMSGRYISYVKPGDLTAMKPGPGYTMTFAMKVSPGSFKTLLQNAGLLNENDTLPVVLPLVSFYDRVGIGTYKWWQPGDITNKRFLLTNARLFESSLRQAFKKQAFHLIRPMEMGGAQILPLVFQNDRVSPDDREFFGRMFQAPLVVDGQVEFTRSQLGSNLYRIDIKMSAIQLSNNRPIADVSRKYETESGAFETVVDKKLRQVLDSVTQDLASQVFEAWQKGTVGTNIIRLTIRGDIPIQQREPLKDKIRTSVPQIKNIRERLVSGNVLSFEVDSSSSPQELGLKMGQIDLNGMKFQTSSSSDKEIVVDMKR